MMLLSRARALLVLPLLTACPPTPTTPTDSNAEAADTQDSVPLLEDSDPEPVETGWPVPTGEDVAVIDTSERTVSLHFNDEQDLSSEPELVWTIPISNATVLLCDFDGDGLDDAWVLTGEDASLELSVYLNEGGSFAREAAYEVMPGFNAQNYSYGCGNLSGSGKADFVAFKKDSQKLYFYENTGSALDTANPIKTTVSTGTSTKWVVADYDGDGTDELGVFAAGALKVYRVTSGAPQTSSPLITATIPEDYDVAALDLDANGVADLAIWNGAAFVVWPGTGEGFDNTRATAFVLQSTGKPAGANLR